ncbi:CotH kinase family protein [Mangrovibacterium sp.]|uniref:CotH kinase family protein n=1 Tax=Mangrovibacterium sp. TaxID=1961364 RepID=UPI003569E66A
MTLAFCTGKKQTDSDTSRNLNQGKSSVVNYATVFPDDKVNRIDIKIDEKQWAQMVDDLKSNIGSSEQMPPRPENNLENDEGIPLHNNAENRPQRRAHAGPPPEGGGHRMPQEMGNDSIRSQNRGRRMGPPRGGMLDESTFNPKWSYCDVLFNKEQWQKVGIRFKGNSSLHSTYQSGIGKLSLKLDFEHFEDQFPESKNQRFYGFQQLNLKNNYQDRSFMREKVASDLFAEFGLVTPKSSFCELYVDYGEGPQYFGLYTLVEEVDDTVIETGFLSENGNLYKPEGAAATFAKDSFKASEMNKKNNRKSKDISDVQKLNKVLNSSLRTENNQAWKNRLNKIFDVPVFLKWLAANTIIQNWDTYGNMYHNYYLYNNPSTNKLVWIPWDNNEALQPGKMGGAPSLSLMEIDEGWPLIRYILDDEEWNAEYLRNVQDFSDNIFTPEKMTEIYTNYQNLITNSVIGNRGERPNYTFLRSDSDFGEEVSRLKQHVVDRKTAVQEFLSK